MSNIVNTYGSNLSDHTKGLFKNENNRQEGLKRLAVCNRPGFSIFSRTAIQDEANQRRSAFGPTLFGSIRERLASLDEATVSKLCKIFNFTIACFILTKIAIHTINYEFPIVTGSAFTILIILAVFHYSNTSFSSICKKLASICKEMATPEENWRSEFLKYGVIVYTTVMAIAYAFTATWLIKVCTACILEEDISTDLFLSEFISWSILVTVSGTIIPLIYMKFNK